MWYSFLDLAAYLKYNPKKVSVDNAVFKLHYRWTFCILIACTTLISLRIYVGDHIRCVSSNPALEKPIDKFCFFTPTFTVVKHYNETALLEESIPHPGVGSFNPGKDEIKQHAYYQWVPFVLFAQALMFYLPHLLWKAWEKKRIYNLVNGLKMIGLTRHLKNDGIKVGGRNIPSLEEAEDRLRQIRNAFRNRLDLNEFWGAKLIFCELLNLLNIILQVYITNKFLGGQFYRLGLDFLKDDWTGPMDSLDITFPKMTKCMFNRFGPSGTVVTVDVLCVMGLNIIHEKIYCFLWFWYIFVAIASFLSLVWRSITISLYKRISFNAFVFRYATPSVPKLERKKLRAVLNKCNFANWMFLYFLAANMAGFLFKKIIDMIVEEAQLLPPEDESDENAANRKIYEEGLLRVTDEVDSDEKPKEKVK